MLRVVGVSCNGGDKNSSWFTSRIGSKSKTLRADDDDDDADSAEDGSHGDEPDRLVDADDVPVRLSEYNDV